MATLAQRSLALLRITGRSMSTHIRWQSVATMGRFARPQQRYSSTGISVEYTLSDGTKKIVVGKEGDNLLELAHTADIPLEGACECALACSTCHLYVDEEWFDKLPEIEEEEEDMLDVAFGLQENSRLGCQVKLTKELDGIKVTLPDGTRNFDSGNTYGDE